jgi:rhodanese-related sulfurtransferase
MIREITRQQIDLKTAQGERVVLVEAQPLQAYETAHIPFALQIPLHRVRELADEYLPNYGAEIVVYGEDDRSPEVDDVARQLMLLGYGNLYVYRGGKKDWFSASEFRESVHYPPPPGEHVRFDDSAGASGQPSSATSNQPQVPGLRVNRHLEAEQREGRNDPRFMAGTGPYQPGRSPQMAKSQFSESKSVSELAEDWSQYLRGALLIFGGYAVGRGVWTLLQRRKRYLPPVSTGNNQSAALAVAHEHRVVRIEERDAGLEREARSFHSASAAE